MNFDTFRQLAQEYNFIPVYERITADLLTPVLAYQKLRANARYAFLFESVEGIGRIARYSFIGKNPSEVIINRGESISVEKNGQIINLQENLFHYLKNRIHQFCTPRLDDIPYFSGGIVGYLGYENIGLWKMYSLFQMIIISEHPIPSSDSMKLSSPLIITNIR